MLNTKLLAEAERDHDRRLEYIREHETLLNAYGSWLHEIGGNNEDVGEFANVVTLHDNTGGAPTLRLILYASSMPVAEAVSHIQKLQEQIGQHLQFVHCVRTDMEIYIFNHPKIGEISICISGRIAKKINPVELVEAT